MAKEKNILHLYLYGDVYNAQGADSADYGVISITTVMQAFNKGNGSDADSLLLHIHSYGGDLYESLAVYDFLKGTGKPINTVVEGVCASAATVFFLLGEKRSLTPNSKFLIHNPWTFAMGNADDLEETAERLRQDEDKLVSFYLKHIDQDEKVIRNIMSEERFLDADEALELGFATEILDQVNAFKLVYNSARIPQITNKKELNIMAETQNALSFVDKVKALASELLGIKADGTPDPIPAPEPQPEPVANPEPQPEPQPEPKSETELENERLKKELEDLKAESLKKDEALVEADKAMAHMKTTFVPQARQNNFKREGQDKTGEVLSLKERMQAEKEARKGNK